MKGKFFNETNNRQLTLNDKLNKKQSKEHKIILQVIDEILVEDFKKSISPAGALPTPTEIEEYRETLKNDIMSSPEVKKEILDTYLEIKMQQERESFENNKKPFIS